MGISLYSTEDIVMASKRSYQAASQLLFYDAFVTLKDLLKQLEGIGIFIPGENEGQWADAAGLDFEAANEILEREKEVKALG